MSQPQTWQNSDKPALVSKAREIAHLTGERLRDAVEQQGADMRHWSLAGGLAGIAIAFDWMDRCFPGEGWDRSAKQQLAQALNTVQESGETCLEPGLFSGAAGLAFASVVMSRGGQRYVKLRRNLHERVINFGESFIAQLQVLTQFSAEHHDVVSGVTGLGTYALSAGHPEERSELLNACIDFFILTREGEVPETLLFTAPPLIPSAIMREMHPLGYVDCGLAHGVAGPLAFLSIAKLSGVRRAGLDTAIGRIASWLVAKRIATAHGDDWPAAVDFDGKEYGQIPKPTRSAWCYGNPGVGRSLFLAGKALQNQELMDAGTGAVESTHLRPKAERCIYSPSFCHGFAGLLQITMRMANDTGKNGLRDCGDDVLEELLSCFDSRHSLGFQDSDSFNFHNRAELLEGTAGIILVLLSASFPIEPSWDRMMLLS